MYSKYGLYAPLNHKGQKKIGSSATKVSSTWNIFALNQVTGPEDEWIHVRSNTTVATRQTFEPHNGSTRSYRTQRAFS
jgi:hypothetical protein